MSVAVGAQITCVELELERLLKEDSTGLPDIIIDRLGTFALKESQVSHHSCKLH